MRHEEADSAEGWEVWRQDPYEEGPIDDPAFTPWEPFAALMEGGDEVVWWKRKGLPKQENKDG